ncbi:hypothetical protein FRC15_003591 [Serendipita sp. 397]|nr:hypothetical protein FRC15_003591 [Serendipita sp. 397]KAG8796990.1 hypothetical protein FRC16_009311 [Serendipita sp. 398]
MICSTLIQIGNPRHGLDDGEPRTVAIGARATVLRLPKLWNTHLRRPSQDKKKEVGWNDVNPIALQLTTPHTTAEYPSKTKAFPRSHRLYPAFLFHHSGSQNPVGSAAAESIHQQPFNQPDSQKQPIPLESEKELRPHPVVLSYIISMPNRHYPAYSSPSTSTPSTLLTGRMFPDAPNPDVLSHLEIGTDFSVVNLPSVLIPEHELRTWWDTSVNTFTFPTSRTGTTVYASPFYTNFRDQRNAQRTLRAQEVEEVMSTTVPDVVWTRGYGGAR